jgi:hypothetical protein
MTSILARVFMGVLLIAGLSGTAAAAPPAAPVLMGPASGARAGYGTGLTWGAVAGADSYRVCIKTAADDLCGVLPLSSAGEQVHTVAGQQTGFYPSLNDLRSIDGRQVRWKVAACRANECTYSPFRSITFFITPELRTPADTAVMVPGPNTFAWSPVQNATAYRLCLSRPGLACGAPGSLVQQTTTTSYSIQGRDDPLGLGNLIHWTVAACYGPQCVYNPRYRAITRGAVAGAPTLEAPPNETLVSPSSAGFRWGNVSGAHSYKLCVSRPGVACGTGDSQVWTVTGLTATRTIPQPLSRVERLHWTVAACRDAACTYQTQVRSILMAGGPVTFKVKAGVVDGQAFQVGGINRFLNHGDPLESRVCLGTPDQPALYGSATTDREGRVNFHLIPLVPFTTTSSAWGKNIDTCHVPGFRPYVEFCPPQIARGPYNNSTVTLDLNPAHPNRSLMRVEDGALVLVHWTNRGQTREPVCGPVPEPRLR